MLLLICVEFLIHPLLASWSCRRFPAEPVGMFFEVYVSNWCFISLGTDFYGAADSLYNKKIAMSLFDSTVSIIQGFNQV